MYKRCICRLSAANLRFLTTCLCICTGVTHINCTIVLCRVLGRTVRLPDSEPVENYAATHAVHTSQSATQVPAHNDAAVQLQPAVQRRIDSCTWAELKDLSAGAWRGKEW